jgi:hypothetical protein
VYRIYLPHDDLSIRVYSSIERSTKKSRDKGKDAIRTVIYSDEYNKPIAGKTYTQRIETWRRNLQQKIQELHNSFGDVVETCDECGSYMELRSGEYGEFYGCLEYPECDNTKQV